MKNKSSVTPRKTTHAQVVTNKRAQNKDDLDSREGEEQLRKGDDVTHNRKEKQNERRKKD